VLKLNETCKAHSFVTERRQEGSSWRRLDAYFQGRGWIIAGCTVGLVLILIYVPITGDQPVAALENLPPAIRMVSPHGLPPFVTAPDATDLRLVCMAILLVAAVLAAGVFFFWLHALPDRLVDNSTKVHFDIVAVRALLTFFTHIHVFWVAALLIAFVKIPELSIPDFSGLLARIAGSLERMADARRWKVDTRPAEPSNHRYEKGA
jgi:hypothetical protein